MLEKRIEEAYDIFKDYAKVSIKQREIWDNRIIYLGGSSIALALANSLVNGTHIFSGTIALTGIGTSAVWYVANKFRYDVPLESMNKVYRAKITEIFYAIDKELNRSEGLISGIYFNKKLLFDERFGIRSNNKMKSINNEHSFYMRKERGVYRIAEVSMNNHRYVKRGETEDKFTISNRGIYISIESTRLPKYRFHLNTKSFEQERFMELNKISSSENLVLYSDNEELDFDCSNIEEILDEHERFRVTLAGGSLNLYYKYSNNYKVEDSFRNTKLELKRIENMTHAYHRALDLIDIIYDNLKKG